MNDRILNTFVATASLLLSLNVSAKLSTLAATGDYASDLGVINGVFKTNGYTRDICAAKFPDLTRKLDDAYANWRMKYKPFIQEISLRWSDMAIQVANEEHTSIASVHEYYNNEFEQLRTTLKTMYSKNGDAEFRRICERYPDTLLLGTNGDVEKNYREHVETIRRVKLK